MKRGSNIPLPSSFTSKSNLRSWSQIPVLTASLPYQSIQAIQQQSNLFIKHFGSSFSVMTTGITLPKKLSCYSQTGDCYTQMLKKDEIRSDVVVQQLFLLLNSLLEEEKVNYQPSHDTLKVNLMVLRTYHVLNR